MPIADLGDVRIRYNLTGHSGPVLVLSNSLGTDYTMWDRQMSALSRHFRILRYDTRGHGGSSVPPGEYTVEQLGGDVLTLLDSLKLDRVDFCGLSMGGTTGMWLGINAPERIDRLVLCNTAAKIGTPDNWATRIHTVRKEGMKPVASAVIERWFTPEFRTAYPEKIAPAQKMLESAPPDGYASNCAAVRDADFRETVSRIQSRTLVIYGSRDPAISVADAQFLVDQIPGARGVELSCSHLSNVEQADAFNQAVTEFLLSRGANHG